MRVFVHYEYSPSGTVTADVTGDIEEFRGLLDQLGILQMKAPEKRDQAGSGFYSLRSLYAAMEEQFPLVLGTRGARQRVSARDHATPDTRTAAGRRQRLSEHAEIYERHEAEHEKRFREYLCDGKASFAFMEERAQSVYTGSAGGFIVPRGFYDKVLVAMKAYDGLFDAETVLPTSPGVGNYSLPLDDDSSNVATLIAESGTSVATDSVYDSVTFVADAWRSGQVRASMEIAADSFFDLAGLLAGSFGRRFARGIGAAHITTLLTSATLGKTAASATAVTGDELLDLIASVDPAYGQNGAFLMNFTTFTALRKLKGSTSGDYLLDIDTDGQGRPTIFDHTVFISPSMPNMTTGLRSIAFGSLERFFRREVVGSLVVQTLVERYAELGQIAYEARWRTSGQLVKAANSPVPVKYLQQA